MRAKTKFRTSAELFSRREAALLAGVPLKAVDKAIEEKVVRARRSGGAGTLLDADDVMALAVIGKAGFPLRSQAKRKIRRWLQEVQPYASSKKPELQLSDVVVIRLDPAFRDAFKQLSSYREGRQRFIESNAEIRRGEPVISGTRLPVRAVAERVKGGETIDDLIEDYPTVPRKAFEAALIYAQAHPRRGRPARPWRDA
ncbi:MAG: DUF433 domain-containing protein [Solirubrobacterales bacterium]|nr:DUF433 domain-containing protein [Solirubrobacterales bacterium]